METMIVKILCAKFEISKHLNICVACTLLCLEDIYKRKFPMKIEKFNDYFKLQIKFLENFLILNKKANWIALLFLGMGTIRRI